MEKLAFRVPSRQGALGAQLRLLPPEASCQRHSIGSGAAHCSPATPAAALVAGVALASRAAERYVRRWQKQPKVVRGLGIVEGIVGGVALYTLLRPKSAPSADKLKKDEKTARSEMEAASEAARSAAPDKAESARERLRKALRRLSEVESELAAATSDEQEYPMPAFLQDSGVDGQIMVGVTGASGVGKSSLVNALRRIKDTDPDAAKTGITESTLEPKMYRFCNGENRSQTDLYGPLKGDQKLSPGARVLLEGSYAGPAELLEVGDEHYKARLADGQQVDVTREQIVGIRAECMIWDLPGIGTPTFPQATYLKRMGIRYFDVVILVTSTRFTEAELLLAEELQKFNVPYFMVRNKVDIDIQSEIDDEEEDVGSLSSEERDEIAQQTLNCIKSYFTSEYKLDDVYCISTKRKFREKYDFVRLQQGVEAGILRQRGVS
eukprot:TRINITY_DN104217_c0_g1_i1.p1 TRINITY_DN104217_c0_g1~~TRINITY_DN104217_c0_g1_i1.p1  ORF type:complete len:468 (+),score=91.91 TRINITY_DN104217_c0_g1_i1:96-1406(+)